MDRFVEVLIGLHKGFDIGISTLTLSKSFFPPNHYCLSKAHEFIITKYCTEIELGRVSPKYAPQHAYKLFRHFQTSPLNIVESIGGKLHMTIDLSYPRNNPVIPSINSFIDTDTLQYAGCWLLAGLDSGWLCLGFGGFSNVLFRVSGNCGLWGRGREAKG